MLAGSPPDPSRLGTPGAAPPPRLPRLTIHEQQLLLERAAVVLHDACIPTAEHMKTAALGLIHGGTDAPLISDMIAVLVALSTDLRKLWALYDPALRAAAHAIKVDLESRAEEERNTIKAANNRNVLHEEEAAVQGVGRGVAAVGAAQRKDSIVALLAQGQGAVEMDQGAQDPDAMGVDPVDSPPVVRRSQTEPSPSDGARATPFTLRHPVAGPAVQHRVSDDRCAHHSPIVSHHQVQLPPPVSSALPTGSQASPAPGTAETAIDPALRELLLADPLGHLLVAPGSPFVATSSEHDVITMSDVRIALGLRDPRGLRDKGCAFPPPFDWDLLAQIGVKRRAPPVPDCLKCSAPRTECGCSGRVEMTTVMQEGTQKVVVVGVRRRQ
ncbi:hypothetical protein AMAG_10718 [Allomyces macrogynus ATCC 38327]|uniref:Uncharacterized protein n=1 Tax=Allomyces macrogynus (strain ATCC 38327) TaxID=578462 RepID=A0A0L0SRT0_ALLM3|nr:hypothetical protein AMAG_10718 [Allomyces macrogynus ATCC 38327]|eukprot:KNE65054.1 hypothetical protein AMAG_10718 [Allomyces macrogynus ATCC 38327]